MGMGERVLGIDLGIGSCGWAMIREGENEGAIITMGVRTFDVPETDKERTPTNQIRRQNRLSRRVTRRRAQRKRAVRTLCCDHGLTADTDPETLTALKLDPWTLRAEGLDRRLDGPELAIVLLHVAAHRGFKSNSKRARGANQAAEDSKMLAAIEATRADLGAWTTIGEKFATDPAIGARKRNKGATFDRSILRDDQAAEVAVLFHRQRQHGNDLATPELESAYATTAFHQRPLADSEHLVRNCPFLPTEKRAAVRSYAFERFRLLTRLAALRLISGRVERALTPEEMRAAGADQGSHTGMNFARLRRMIALDPAWRFAGVDPAEEGKRDVVSRHGHPMGGSHAIRQALGDGPWRHLLAMPDRLDRIAFVLSFRDDLDSIRAGLEEIGLEPLILARLMEATAEGDFDGFKGAGHLSAAACRRLMPHLEQGMDYAAACAAAGFDHAARRKVDLTEIGNPIARKALTEAAKQVKAIIQAHGLPDRIHVELARDIGKSIKERGEIEKGIEKRNKQKDEMRKKFAADVGRTPSGTEDLLRYELWVEQLGKCIYTDDPIHPDWLVAADNRVQVDHILPWSRSGDDSFMNKVLCLATANQAKREKTPYEWLKDDTARWDAFVARVETNRQMRGFKKRNLLLRDASVLEERFKSRNLNDTRYACRLLLDHLASLYPDDGTHHVRARPGALTDRLRRAWGVQDLKKGPDGKRVSDDRHHALDALIVAATTESALNRLTRAFQEAELRGTARDFAGFAPPWPGFVADARAAFDGVFVSRPERHRARGEGHAATIRSVEIDEAGAKAIYERKAIDKLTLGDLDKIKNPENRNGPLIASLRAWIEAGRPEKTPPISPQGDPIAKVRLLARQKDGVAVRDGLADRGDMARVDVFRKATPKGRHQFFLVPIYPHQVMDRVGWPTPPNRAIAAHKPERDWPEMNTGYEFLFSVRNGSYLEVVRPGGEVISGYFKGVDRDGGQISIALHTSNLDLRSRIGTRTLLSFRKFNVDRLGNRNEIVRETRTWHGVVCT